MKGLSKHGQGIQLLRENARETVKTHSAAQGNRDLTLAMHALLQDFRTEFDVPGCRYYEVYPSRTLYALMPSEQPDLFAYPDDVIEINRAQFLGRKELHFGYEDEI